MEKVAKVVVLNVLVLSALAVSAGASAAWAADRPIAILAARLIDGTGKPPIENAVVVVRGGTIEAVGTAASIRIPDGAEVIDLGEETLLPGLIDTHGHLNYRPGFGGKGLGQQSLEPAPQQLMRMLRNARTQLLSGVTTMRLTGENDFTDLVVRDAITAGLHPGPRIVPSGIPITSPHGHGPAIWWQDGADNIRKAVRENAAHGAKWQKLLMIDVDPDTAQMTLEDTKVAVEEAHRLGLKVTVHCTGRWGSAIRTAVLAGADNIEHARPLTPEIIRLLVEHNVSISVTPVVYVYFRFPKNFWELLDGSKNGQEWNHRFHEMFYNFRAEHPEVETQDQTIQSADEPERAKRDYLPAIRTRQREFLAAHRAGIPISMGQDSLTGTLPVIMEFLVEAGFTPIEAIQAATSVPARLIGYGDSRGTLEKGKAADIISVRGNPAKNIRDMLNLHFIMKAGVRYDQLSWR